MVQTHQQSFPAGTSHPPAGAHAENDALAQADRVAAETLIRTTIQVLSNGAAVRDLDGLVQRNAGKVSHADLRAGRLGSNVLGDILGTVEQAKGSSTFNWSAATPQQIAAYLIANGFTGSAAHRLMGAQGPGADKSAGDSSVNRGGNQFAELREASIRSGVSAESIAAYTKLGFDQNTIGMFGKAGLGIHDYRALENMWGRQEVVRGAGIAGELGFRGRQAVGDVTGIADEERDLLNQYKKEKDPNTRKELETRIRALPPRKDEDESKKKERDNRNLKRLREDFKKKVALDGDRKANFGETHDARVKDIQKLGLAQTVEAQHRTTVADLGKKQGAVQTDTDVLAALMQDSATPGAPAETSPKQAQAAPGDASPRNTAAADNTAKKSGEPKPPQRQAVHQKALNPTV